jgi:phosphatidylserine/phosphatidylglycerophosphate/cardiolipin synthase-like enzyme
MLPKPLPMNIPQFNDWARRIIIQAGLPTNNLETQKFALASMILQTSPTDYFRPDQYYVDCLRKAASDQVALQVMEDIKIERAKKMAAQNQETKGEATPTLTVVADEKTP